MSIKTPVWVSLQMIFSIKTYVLLNHDNIIKFPYKDICKFNMEDYQCAYFSIFSQTSIKILQKL